MNQGSGRDGIVYQLAGGLTAEMIRRIHQAALAVVERVGISVPHAGIRGLLADHAGVAVVGDTVRFKPFLVEQAIQKVRTVYRRQA